MSTWWKNPSRNAVIYDRRNNRHIQPGETTTVAPDPMLVRTGRLIAGSSSEPVAAAEVAGPVTVVSSLIIDDHADSGLEIVDDPADTPSERRRKK
jgi:hypothetical protein